MSDIEEIRAKLRSSPSPASSAGWFGLGALATCALAFMAGLLVLRIVPLDSFSPVQTSLVPVEQSESTPSFLRSGEPPAPPARTVVANYEGKSAAEIGKIADQLCFHRAHTRYPHWSKMPRLTNQNLADFRPEHMDHFDELLRCLLSEGTRRYCLGSERRMIVAEITTYFRGIATRNQLAKWYFDENRRGWRPSGCTRRSSVSSAVPIARRNCKGQPSISTRRWSRRSSTGCATAC